MIRKKLMDKLNNDTQQAELLTITEYWKKTRICRAGEKRRITESHLPCFCPPSFQARSFVSVSKLSSAFSPTTATFSNPSNNLSCLLSHASHLPSMHPVGANSQ